jgi:hypothetical protein
MIEGIQADVAGFEQRFGNDPDFRRSQFREAARKRRQAAGESISYLQKTYGAGGQHQSRELGTNERKSAVTVKPCAMEIDLTRGHDPWQKTTMRTARA